MGGHVDPKQLMEVAKPGLQAGDAVRLAQDVTRRWRASDLCPLLRHASPDVRRVTAVIIGLVGDMTSVPCLARRLRDSDEQVNQMAEHGLWSIWFRSGDPQAACALRSGVTLIGAEKYKQALVQFQAALRIDPDYAEAYNQCAIAHFFLGHWDDSLTCCKRAVSRVPTHFGAISGMGHCHLQLGRLDKALQCYEWSLRINPRMPAIDAAVQRLRKQIRDSNDSSGMYFTDALQV